MSVNTRNKPRLMNLAGLRTNAKSLFQAGVERSPAGKTLFWHVPGGDSGVALTFDDGPDPDGTPRILDRLAERGVRATFFVIGEAARRYPELVRRIAAEGHALGNHTYTHARCTELTPEELAEELAQTDEALREICGMEVALFRPPWGAIRPAQLLALAREGRSAALWSIDSRDYRGASAAEIVLRCADIRGGDIVLMHDRFPATVEALPRLLDLLEARGLLGVPLEAGHTARDREEGVRRWNTRTAA
jgi:peptidoglycan/xylan/chitin deacetylase (PgdA/CDA1 family)